MELTWSVREVSFKLTLSMTKLLQPFHLPPVLLPDNKRYHCLESTQLSGIRAAHPKRGISRIPDHKKPQPSICMHTAERIIDDVLDPAAQELPPPLFLKSATGPTQLVSGLLREMAILSG